MMTIFFVFWHATETTELCIVVLYTTINYNL